MAAGPPSIHDLEDARRRRRARRTRLRLREVLRRAVPGAVGLGALAGVVILTNPAEVGRALAGFRLPLLIPIAVLYALMYVLQGTRWHRLLAEVGAPLPLRDGLILNAAGQTITALVPLGDLTRALFAAQATGREFGAVAATVTVQELTFTLNLVLFALPVVLSGHLGVVFVLATLAGMAGIVVILTVSPVFCAVHGLIGHVPLLNRVLPAIEELQQETADLLHRPGTLGWSVLDLARAAVAVTLFWLVIQGLDPGGLNWWQAGFVLAVSTIGGAVSLIPGGVGANEASVAALLIAFGVHPGVAGAAALVQRMLMTGMALTFGCAAYAVARRRYPLGGIFQVTMRRPGEPAAA